MIEWVLSSCVLILLVIGLRAVLKGRIGLRLQYALWGLVLLRLLIPVSFGSFAFSVANLAQPVAGSDLTVQTQTDPGNTPAGSPQFQPEVMPDALPDQESGQNAAKQEDASITDILIAVWALGAAVIFAVFLYTNLFFCRNLIVSRRRLDVGKNGLAVFESTAIDTPCLAGILKPAIYVTCGVSENRTVLRHVLEHEAAHYRHGDHIWALLRCVCLSVHWYNPLVWWAALLSRKDGELACDEATVRRLGEEERAEYGRTLIEMTCKRRKNLLTAATMMTSGRSGIRERILLIAKKPKTAVYTLVILILLGAVAVGCTFTGAKQEREPGETLPAVTEPQQTTGTEPVTKPTEKEPMRTEPTQPTTESTTVPQETEPPETQPQNPLGITEIVSATLEWNGVHTVTQASAVNSIETWLYNVRKVESAACPFTAKLTLETEDGRTMVLYMAEDSCAAFMYEGVVYSYAELTEDGYTSNTPFYSLFAPAVIREKTQNGLEGALGYLHYLHWGAYYGQYGPEQTFALLDQFERWVAEDPTYGRFGCMIECGKGLDGAISEGYGYKLAQLYKLAPKEFAWACLGNATDEAQERTLKYLAFEWEMTPEEARAELAAQLAQSG